MQKDFIIPPAVATIIPHSQYMVTLENLEAFAPAVVRFEEQLRKCPKLRATDGMKEHPAIFHCFCGTTNMAASGKAQRPANNRHHQYGSLA